MKKLLTALVLLSLTAASAEACTVMLVTKGASEDGTVIVSHSNDGFGGDPNFVYIPAKDHEKGATRPVYPTAAALGDLPEYNTLSQPYLVAPERAEGLDFPDRPRTKPLGSIPEADHTYAYIDADYPVANEHGLQLAECTDLCDHLPEVPPREGGLFYSTELGRVALERCRTAREAVELMGALIDEYGLWGTAEALIVADREEGWIFEMQPSPDKKGGLWIAEKIPDGHFFIAANQLRIRAIREGDADQMFNPGLPEKLKTLGWAVYDEKGRIDWTESLQGKEYTHPYYSLRRVWRAMSLVAPSRNLPSQVKDWDTKAYPLSLPPDKKLGVEDLMALYRDHYQDTAYDKAASPLSGLFGSPYHYDQEMGERSILSAKTSFTFIAQSGGDLPCPLLWLSLNTPMENPFVPLTVSNLPKTHYKALRDTYDPSKMYWASNEVMALTQGYYNIMAPIVSEAVRATEEDSRRLVEDSLGLPRERFAERLRRNAEKITADWKALSVKLLMKYDAGAGVRYRHLPDPRTPASYQEDAEANP